MKKIICLCLCLCLLAGCTAQVDPPPYQSPVYDKAPAADTVKIVVGGKELTNYVADELAYFRLDELTDAFGGAVNTPEDTKPPYTCSFSLAGKLYEMSTDVAAITTENETFSLGHNPIFDGQSWYFPYQSLLTDYNRFEDSEQNKAYYTQYPTTMPEGKRLPILMYHAVGDEPWGIASLFVRPDDLEEQLIYLKENGYTTITFEDVGRLDEIEKPVMLTFDDGYDDNYTQLLPLLKKHNAKATVFVITGEIGKPYYLTEEQIQEMSASGHISIQSHTVTHPFLSDLNEEQLEDELLGSKKTLARLTGKEPFVICYPTGKSSALSREVCARYYKFGLLMNGGVFTTNGDNFNITRSFVSRTDGIGDFASML